jgi:hypothetical protein
MKESKRKPYKINWFKFYPTDFFAVMSKSDVEAGKLFKQLLERLASNKAPKDSVEERMIEEAKAYSEWKRQVAYMRWKNREPEEEPPRERPQRNRTAPRPPKIPPSKGVHGMKKAFSSTNSAPSIR